MFCPNCGQQLPNDTKFCINCGSAIQFTPTPPSATQSGNDQSVPYAIPIQKPSNMPNVPVNQQSPVQPALKRRKAWYKRWWIWVILGIVSTLIISAIGNTYGKKTKPSNTGTSSSTASAPIATTASATETPSTQAPEPKEDYDSAPEPKEKEDTVPREYTNALRSAENYNSFMPMSKQALYDQLTSEYGDKFPPEAAQYAIDNIDADWKENAVKEAKNYLELFSMSKAELYDQLVSEYGGKYTPEEAQYAVDQVY